MKFRFSDLRLEELKGYRYDDFPAIGYENQPIMFGAQSYSVKIGKLEISQIIQCNNGKFIIQDIYGSFKSLEHAINAILRRLNNK